MDSISCYRGLLAMLLLGRFLPLTLIAAGIWNPVGKRFDSISTALEELPVASMRPLKGFVVDERKERSIGMGYM